MDVDFNVWWDKLDCSLSACPQPPASWFSSAVHASCILEVGPTSTACEIRLKQGVYNYTGRVLRLITITIYRSKLWLLSLKVQLNLSIPFPLT